MGVSGNYSNRMSPCTEVALAGYGVYVEVDAKVSVGKYLKPKAEGKGEEGDEGYLIVGYFEENNKKYASIDLIKKLKGA